MFLASLGRAKANDSSLLPPTRARRATAETTTVERLPIKELTLLVQDLQAPRPFIFWTDLFCCLLALQIGLYLSAPFPDGSFFHPVQAIAGFTAAAFALYRASYFNHELAHHSRRLPGFEFVWNLVIGFPLLIPSFLYSDHRNHHSDQAFATRHDAEYLPEHLRNARGAVALLALAFVLPFIYIVRFAILVPAGWVFPAIRHWIDVRASSLGILGLSRRAAPTANELKTFRRQEFACFCYILAVGASLVTGIIPLRLVTQVYAVIVCMLVLHGMRVMVGHRYRADGSGTQDRNDQVGDSFNFTASGPIIKLFLPVGFHLHALHHLFPNIPYHNMAEAHRRITAFLPNNSPYHMAESRSYFAELARFIVRTDRLATQ
jgi:fatty acid desaturase